MTVEWVEDVPAERSTGRSGQLKQAVEELRTRPGRWAVIATYDKTQSAYSTASQLRTRYADSCDFRARVVDGVGKVYGRFNSSGSTSEGAKGKGT